MDTALLRPYVGAIRIRSRFTPEVVIGDPFGPGAPSPAVTAITNLIQPAFYIDAPDGSVAYSYEPAGTPDGTLAPLSLLAAMGILALAGYGAWKLTLGRRA